MSRVRVSGAFRAACLTACLVSFAAAPTIATAGSYGRSCGSVKYTISGSKYTAKVRGRSVACGKARSVIKYAVTHPSGNGPSSPKGWQCARGGSPEVSPYAVRCEAARGSGEIWLMNG